MCPPTAVRGRHRRRRPRRVGDEARGCVQRSPGRQEGGEEGEGAQKRKGEEGEGRRAAARRRAEEGRAPAQNPGQEEPVALERRLVEADLQEQPARGLEEEALGDVRPEGL